MQRHIVEFTSVPVKELPYPHGLGKMEHKPLEVAMDALLGDAARSPAAHEATFWDRPYQDLVAEHLGPYFAPGGHIAEVAQTALARARKHPEYPLRGGDDAAAQYQAGLPPKPDYPPGTEGHILRWLYSPPKLFVNASGQWSIGDGRHRLSYLRSCVQPENPEFPVLVRITRGCGFNGVSGLTR